MRLWTNVLVALVVVSLAGFVMAKQPKAAAADKGIKGAVVSVDKTNLKIMVKGKKGADAEEKTVAIDDKTVVTIDGKPGKAEDLKKAMKVTVTPSTGTATKIEATSKAAKAPAPAPAAK